MFANILLTFLLIVVISNLPLSDLVDTALIQIRKAFPSVEFHAESVASKIKLLATRESYVQSLESNSVNAFEDGNAGRMWRWEIISLELLPDDCTTKVKKARAARKKVRSHSKALCDLLKALNQAKTLLQDTGSSQTKCDAISTKISNAEEKVLKFEREAERARIAEETKKKKEVEKAKEELEKQKEKTKAHEAQELKKKETQSKAELKRRKEEDKQREHEEKERKLKKQRTIMQSFFSHQSPNAKRTKPAKPATPASSAAAVDTEKFWSRLNASDHHVPLFPELTPRAVASRVRRTRKVPVQVYETVMPDGNAFGAQPYAEPKTIRVANKYKYLSFYEDCRPPYHGTWTKGRSPLVTGKNPFVQDTKHLDYDVDSEGEWEEGDCEVGEDVEEDGPDDEEEDMDREDADDQDGFFCDDDDMGSDDEVIDEETKLLRKKKLEARKLQAINSNLQKKAIVDQGAVCIIAPGAGGKPADESLKKLPEGNEIIEGVSAREAFDLLSSHMGRILVSEGPCLDAFPPPLIEEGNLDDPAPSTPVSDEMSHEDLITFVEFVHHSSLPSKDRLVEELRTVHKTITSSRAQATRKLDSIAEKKRHPNSGVYWEVKRDILEELGIEELLVSNKCVLSFITQI
jgi:chromatin assembly factor 1 subunit A